jgi:hypothetical protein
VDDRYIDHVTRPIQFTLTEKVVNPVMQRNINCATCDFDSPITFPVLADHFWSLLDEEFRQGNGLVLSHYANKIDDGQYEIIFHSVQNAEQLKFEIMFVAQLANIGVYRIDN